MQDATADDVLLFLSNAKPICESLEELLLPVDLSVFDCATPRQALVTDETNESPESRQSLQVSIGVKRTHGREQVVVGKKRRTRRQDIMSLREQVSQLTEQLNGLKTRAEIYTTVPVSRENLPVVRPRSTARQASTGHESRWKMLAAKELERRQRSEDQNHILRETLKAYIRRNRRLRLSLSRRLLDDVSRVSSSFFAHTSG